MKRSLFNYLKFISAPLLSAALTLSCTSPKEPVTPPNIIVFLVDDMGLMDSSEPFISDGNGHTTKHPLNDYYRTPNMEKLADQGIKFTNFYAHSVCSPSRTSILTGQNSARHRTTNWILSEENNRATQGPTDWNWTGLTKNSVTLPRLLQQQGYQTIHVGKAHFGPIDSEGENPLNLGFNENIGGSSIGQPGSYLGEDGYGALKGNKKRAVPGLEKYHGSEVFLTEALTLEAKEAISRSVIAGKPFYLNMAHYAVHAPFYSDKRFAEHYKNSGKSQDAQAYATLIEGIDKSLGDLVAYVKELGVGDNTFIVFLGDNGSDAPLPIENDYSSSSPLKGKKGNHWEGGMRIPFIASWITPNKENPNQIKVPVASNSVQDQMGTIMDLLPTIGQMCHIEFPKDYPLDGFNLKEQLNNERNSTRSEVFLNHYPHEHRTNYFTSYVNKDWKVVYHYPIEETPTYDLFNIKKDPFETLNLADSNPEKLKTMMVELRDELINESALYPEKDGKILEVIIPN